CERGERGRIGGEGERGADGERGGEERGRASEPAGDECAVSTQTQQEDEDGGVSRDPAGRQPVYLRGG
ncbi:hypothetical protein M9458_039395, partial [Cirrhinus mrigala]